jgi:hypothetical protein
MTGRTAGLDALAGEGVEVLRSRAEDAQRPLLPPSNRREARRRGK